MAFEPVHPEVARYLDSLVPPRVPELQAMEAEAERTAFPIIGPAAGYFCYLITRLVEGIGHLRAEVTRHVLSGAPRTSRAASKVTTRRFAGLRRKE